jgi:hypothetical protein
MKSDASDFIACVNTLEVVICSIACVCLLQVVVNCCVAIAHEMEACVEHYHVMSEFLTADRVATVEIHSLICGLYMIKTVDLSTVCHWAKKICRWQTGKR